MLGHRPPRVFKRRYLAAVVSRLRLDPRTTLRAVGSIGLIVTSSSSAVPSSLSRASRAPVPMTSLKVNRARESCTLNGPGVTKKKCCYYPPLSRGRLWHIYTTTPPIALAARLAVGLT